MPVYLVVPIANNAVPLEGAVIAHFAETERHRVTANAGWLVRHPGTAVEVSNQIGITGQPQGVSSPVGPSIVSLVTNYYGRGSPDMWEWLRTRMEAG